MLYFPRMISRFSMIHPVEPQVMVFRPVPNGSGLHYWCVRCGRPPILVVLGCQVAYSCPKLQPECVKIRFQI